MRPDATATQIGDLYKVGRTNFRRTRCIFMRAHSRCDAARSATATNVGSANCRMPKCKYGYLVEMTHCRTKKGPPLSKFHQKDWWEQNVLFFFLQRSCHRLIPRFFFPFFSTAGQENSLVLPAAEPVFPTCAVAVRTCSLALYARPRVRHRRFIF